MLRKHTMLPQVMLIALTMNTAICFPQPGNRASGGEKLEMTIDTSNNILPFDKIAYQKAYTMDEREGRGLLASFLINKGVQGIQSMIDNRKKKYIADYFFAIKDESFYDQVSTDGPFDPTGMRFKGFTVARIIRGEDRRGDTMFVAKFSIDTSSQKINEIMNNGIFRLRLDSFGIKNARVRLPRQVKKLNLDFEISFLASYISSTGQIYQDATVGKFIYSIRNAPLDPNDPSYNKFYSNLALRRPECTGQSFLIPRSAGYFKNDVTKKVEQCWGEGLFSVKVAVKECSKNSFADKLIIYSSNDILTLGNAALQKKFGGSSSGTSRSSSASKPTPTKKTSN